MLYRKFVNNNSNNNSTSSDDVDDDDEVEHHTRSKEPPTSTQYNSKIESIIPASGKREASERVHLSIANIATTSHLHDKSSHSSHLETSEEEEEELQKEHHDAANIEESNDLNEKKERNKSKDKVNVKSGTIVAPDQKIVESIDQMLATAITEEQHNAHTQNGKEFKESTYSGDAKSKKNNPSLVHSSSESINVRRSKSVKPSYVAHSTAIKTNIKDEEEKENSKEKNKNFSRSNKWERNERVTQSGNNINEREVSSGNTLQSPKVKKKLSSAVTKTNKAANDPSNIPIARVILKVLTYLWPKNDYKIKLLVTSSVMCVLLAKCLKVIVPF